MYNMDLFQCSYVVLSRIKIPNEFYMFIITSFNAVSLSGGTCWNVPLALNRVPKESTRSRPSHTIFEVIVVDWNGYRTTAGPFVYPRKHSFFHFMSWIWGHRFPPVLLFSLLSWYTITERLSINFIMFVRQDLLSTFRTLCGVNNDNALPSTWYELRFRFGRL